MFVWLVGESSGGMLEFKGPAPEYFKLAAMMGNWSCLPFILSYVSMYCE